VKPDRPWTKYQRRDDISAKRLARLLMPFGITPKVFRTNDKTPRAIPGTSSKTPSLATFLPSLLNPQHRNNPAFVLDSQPPSRNAPKTSPQHVAGVPPPKQAVAA